MRGLLSPKNPIRYKQQKIIEITKRKLRGKGTNLLGMRKYLNRDLSIWIAKF